VECFAVACARGLPLHKALKINIPLYLLSEIAPFSPFTENSGGLDRPAPGGTPRVHTVAIFHLLYGRMLPTRLHVSVTS
jgi:hypothetical protein